MVVRAIALSIALLIGIGTIVPLATEMAEAGPKKSKRYKKKKRGWKGVKKYSKRWWQLYRAQERRKRSSAYRRRALRLRQLRLAKLRQSGRTGAGINLDLACRLLIARPHASRAWASGHSRPV